jgi:ribonuclease D
MRRVLLSGRSWLRALFSQRQAPSPDVSVPTKPHRATPLPAEFRRMISREEIASLPIRRYAGEVSVVHTPAALAAAMRDIRQERVLGFDTETRPAFKKGESYLPCLVQVATASRVYLLQLEQLDCAKAVVELMANPRIIKAGVALAGDVSQLKRLFSFEAAGIVDIGHIARRHGNKQTGLRNLAALFLGWRIAKGAKTTNWSTPQLTPAQIGYAATDAWVSRELYLCFQRLGLTA